MLFSRRFMRVFPQVRAAGAACTLPGAPSRLAPLCCAYPVAPSVQAVKQALHKRRVRLEAEGKVAPKAAQMLHYVIHVSPDSRKARCALYSNSHRLKYCCLVQNTAGCLLRSSKLLLHSEQLLGSHNISFRQREPQQSLTAGCSFTGPKMCHCARRSATWVRRRT